MKEIKTISVKCESQDLKNIAELTELQGSLKSRTDIDFDKIKLSIIKYGFSFPFFPFGFFLFNPLKYSIARGLQE